MGNKIINGNLEITGQITHDSQPIGSPIEITWSELKALRDAGTLAPGSFYRITDYTTTTASESTQSAGHVFDIIVLALENNKLAEEAWAAHHSGDTYFTNSKLEAWRLWYCLDNDATRFGWADATNGKGVIYRMIDEFDNDVAYDFKNILFEGKVSSVKIKVDGDYYEGYMTRSESSDTTIDGTVYYAFSFSFDPDFGSDVETYYTKSLTSMSTWYAISDGVATMTSNVAVKVPTGIIVGSFYYTFSSGTNDASIAGDSKKVYSNIIDEYKDDNAIQQLNVNIFVVSSRNLNCYGNKIGVNSYNNTFNSYCSSNTIDANFQLNTIGSYFSSNTIGSDFGLNVIDSYFTANTIDSGFSANTIGSNFHSNSIGSQFSNNTIGSQFSSNSIGPYCGSNHIYGNSSNNTIGSGFLSNTVGGYFGHNTIGPYCEGNTIDINFGFNTIGSGFCYNTIGSDFSYNIIGSQFNNNTIGRYFDHNTIGCDFQSNTIGALFSERIYVHYCKFDDGVSYISLTSDDTSASASNYLQNVHIHSGVKGVSTANMLTISVPDRKLSYSVDYYVAGSQNININL